MVVSTPAVRYEPSGLQSSTRNLTANTERMAARLESANHGSPGAGAWSVRYQGALITAGIDG